MVGSCVPRDCAYYHTGGVRGRHEQVIADGGEQTGECVGNPAEGEDDGGGERVACLLGDGALNDVAADEEEEGEDVAWAGPLGVNLLG